MIVLYLLKQPDNIISTPHHLYPTSFLPYILSTPILSTPPGILSAVPCPRGTLRNQTGAAAEGDCFPCTPGYYCAQEGAIEVSGECDPRYYCPDFANVTSAQPSGFECPAGFFCIQKTATPQACLPGKTLGFFTLHCSSSLSCINEYLAIDSGGYVYGNGLILEVLLAWIFGL